MMLLALASLGMAATLPAADLPEPTWKKLPRWRGFNLLEKFYKGGKETDAPFREEDFKWIAGWGFNFVRLPMDYREWIVDGDWRKFDEKTLKEIDQAVAWGRKYGVHVLLNFHRAPGYTVASPPEPKSLWTDPEAQEVCALHWRTFARRYKGIPNRNLSFNLFNEPGNVDPAVHAKVVKIMLDAIRAEDPDRLVICDAIGWGGKAPGDELLPLHVAVATRGYAPFRLTHYKATWVGDNASWPVPTWPVLRGPSQFLYGNDDPDHGKRKEPLVLAVNLPESATVSVTVHTVMSASELGIFADGKLVLRQPLPAGAGAGPWTSTAHQEEWNTWQSTYDKAYSAVVPKGAKEIKIANLSGDWITISQVRIAPYPGAPDGEAVIPVNGGEWGSRQGTFAVGPDGRIAPVGAAAVEEDRETLWRDVVSPFRVLEAKGTGVFVGEWGAFSFTPHDVVLRWAADCLANWKRAGWGWAMWNFRGSFGILDSDRSDVAYEDWHGHKLDRRLLELLRAN